MTQGTVTVTNPGDPEYLDRLAKMTVDDDVRAKLIAMHEQIIREREKADGSKSQ